MKKILACALTASLAVLASCSGEEPVKKTGTLTINFGAEAKAYMNYQGYTFWTPKDQISVFSDKGTRKIFTSTLTRSSARYSNFTCSDWILGETPIWAVFCYEESKRPSQPYAVEMGPEDGVFSANVSCYQPISVTHKVGSFGSKADVAVGAITKNGDAYNGELKNAVGLVKITIPAGVENVKEIILEDADGTAPIAGKVTVDCTGDVPVCTPVNGQGKSRISAEWKGDDATSFTAGNPVYFCVIPGESFSPKFTFVRTDGYEASVTGYGSISASTNGVYDCGTPASLEFTDVTLTFAENPFNETIPATSKWNEKATILDLTLKNHTDFSYALKNSDRASSEGKYSSFQLTNSKLVFWGHSAAADGTEYFQINCPTGRKITNVSVKLDYNKGMAVTDLSGNVITSSKTSYDWDLTGTTAENGCRLKFTEIQDYKFTEIKITYIPESNN